MEILNLIKNYFFKKYIRENKVVKNPKLITLQRAKSIGFICNITDEDSYKDMFSLFSKFQNSNRSLWLMGYIDDNFVPYYCLQQLTADFFCNKELNWFGKPNKVQIDDFLKKDFDILIDFTKKPHKPVEYILNLNNAGLVIGGNQYNRNDYDIFIDNPNSDNYNLLENIHKYTLKLMGDTI